MFDNKNAGKVTLITGPMFSGKTLELLRLIDQLDYSKKEYVIFKPEIDTTDKGEIKSRWNKSKEAVTVPSSKELLEEIEKRDKELYAIIIDEVQFFDKGIVKIVDRLAFKGYKIICAGLDRDYTGKPFSVVAGLSSVSEDVIKLHSICSVCGSSAYMSQKVVGESAVTSGTEKIELKTKATYIPVCREHFVYGEEDDA